MRPRYTDAHAGRRLVADAARSTTRAPRSRPGCARWRCSPTARPSGRSGARARRCRRSSPYEAPYRPLLPVAAYALAASRHMHEFGTTPEQLAAVAVQRARLGAGEPAGVVARAAHGRRRPGRPARVRPAGRARLLPGHRRRRGARRRLRRARARAAPAARPRARRRRGARPPPHLVDGRPHADGRGGVRAARLRRGGARAGRRGQRAALRRLHDHADPVPGGPRLLRQGRGRRVRRRAAASRPAGRCRSTRTAAASPTATPGCTGCSRSSRPSAGAREAGDDVVVAHGNGGVLSSQATVVLGGRGDRLGRPSRVAAMDFELTDEQRSSSRRRASSPTRGRPASRAANSREPPLRHRPGREDRRPGLPRRDRPARVRRRRTGLPDLRDRLRGDRARLLGDAHGHLGADLARLLDDPALGHRGAEAALPAAAVLAASGSGASASPSPTPAPTPPTRRRARSARTTARGSSTAPRCGSRWATTRAWRSSSPRPIRDAAGTRAWPASSSRPTSPASAPQEIKGKMGLHASDTAQIGLTDVVAGPDSLLGAVGDGFKVAMTALDSGRYSVAAGCVGICQASVEESVKYAKEREAVRPADRVLPARAGDARRHGRPHRRGPAARAARGRAEGRRAPVARPRRRSPSSSRPRRRSGARTARSRSTAARGTSTTSPSSASTATRA